MATVPHPATATADQLIEARELARELLVEISNGERGHPGAPARRTRWIDETRIREWWATVHAWTATYSPEQETPQCGTECQDGHTYRPPCRLTLVSELLTEQHVEKPRGDSDG